MFVELQLSSAVFGRIVRERLRALDLCVDQPEADEIVENRDGTVVRHVLDRIEIPDDTEVLRQAVPTQTVWLAFPNNFTSFTVPFLQVRQAVTVHLVRVADLEANGPAPTTPSYSLTLKPVFNVRAGVLSAVVAAPGPVQLTYALDHVEFGPVLEAVIPPAQRAAIETLIRSHALPPTVIDLAPLAGLDPTGTVAFGAINAGITCDAAGERVALRIETRKDGDLPPQWFSTDPEPLAGEALGRQWAVLMDSRIMSEAIRAIVGQGMAGSSRFKLRSGPHVSYDQHAPGFVVTLEGEAVDACPFFVDDIDLDVEAEARVVLSVPSTNVLRQDFTFDVGPSDITEEVACAVTAALLWPFIGLVMVDRDMIDLPEYVALLAVHPVIRIAAILFAMETASPPASAGGATGQQCHKIDDEHYRCDDGVDIALPGLGARLDLNAVVGRPAGPVLGGSVPFQQARRSAVERVDVVPFRWKIAGRCRDGFSAVNEAEIFVAVDGPARLCTARVLHDPAQAFALTQDGNSVSVRCTFPPAYTAGPRYPCRVRLVTNKGLRTITLAPPADATEQERDALEVERVGSIAACYKWQEHFTPREEIGWIPDPPPLVVPSVQLWQIVVEALAEGERMTVHLPSGVLLLTAAPSAHGIVHVQLLLDGADDVDRLHLDIDGRLGPDAPRRRVSVQQLLYVRRSSVPGPRALAGMSIERRGTSTVLTVGGDGERRSWDVGSAWSPLLREAAVVAEAHAADRLVVHTGKRVLADVDVPADARRLLAQAGGRGAMAATIGAPRVGGVRQSLFVGDRHGGVLFDVADGAQREVQRFEQRPWFDGTALHGRLLARHDADRAVVDLYEVAGVADV